MIGDNIHTINLGKVTLSQSQHRAVRAINMIKEYVRKHKNTPYVKIDPELAHLIWARGVRRPPRKVTVELIEDGINILVMPYSESVVEDLPPLKEDASKAIDSEETPIEDVAAPAKALPSEIPGTTAGGDDQTPGDIQRSREPGTPDSQEPARTADKPQ